MSLWTWLGDELDFGYTWGDLGIYTDPEGTSDWAKDLDTAYQQANDWMTAVANAKHWSTDDVYNAQYYFDSAYQAALTGWNRVGQLQYDVGDPAIFWDWLNQNWPNADVDGWNELGEAWHAADATAEDVQQYESGGEPDQGKKNKLKWLLVGGGILGVWYIARRF